MLDARQLRELIVRPTLKELGLWHQAAEDLVMGTAAQESRLTYIYQRPKGPALGLWQMEPRTHEDLWARWLPKHADVLERIMQVCELPNRPTPDRLMYDLRYGAAMCRVFYLSKPRAIPSTLAGQAGYWKRWYNSYLGAGKASEYVENYALVA